MARILIIEDNEDMQYVIKRILLGSRRLGELEFESAYQGLEAIELYIKAMQEENPYDLVICDVRMPPGIDGKETLRRLSMRDKKLNAIICSAFDDYTKEEIQSEMSAQKEVAYITKPFSFVDFEALVYDRLNS